jgi:predicted 3-demethylubiquinone-9 3-methyltransferase (glyoxalase superfamily)
MTTPIATPAKNTICLWYDRDAEEAARFYASVFPDSSVKAVHRAPGDYPAGKQGGVLTVEFTVLGIPCFGLVVADHASGLDASHHRFRPSSGQTRVRGHDADGENRYRHH